LADFDALHSGKRNAEARLIASAMLMHKAYWQGSCRPSSSLTKVHRADRP
jgi:hypothetical protein